jgi:uncharacterized protein YqgC (DUF456 family)
MILFITVLFLGLFAGVFGLPGTILILMDALVYSAVTRFETIGIKVILALMLLTVAAEALEFFLGLKGAFPFNLSVKGFWAALGGSTVGIAVLTPFSTGWEASSASLPVGWLVFSSWSWPAKAVSNRPSGRLG